MTTTEKDIDGLRTTNLKNRLIFQDAAPAVTYSPLEDDQSISIFTFLKSDCSFSLVFDGLYVPVGHGHDCLYNFIVELFIPVVISFSIQISFVVNKYLYEDKTYFRKFVTENILRRIVFFLKFKDLC